MQQIPTFDAGAFMALALIAMGVCVALMVDVILRRRPSRASGEEVGLAVAAIVVAAATVVGEATTLALVGAAVWLLLWVLWFRRNG